MKASRAIANKIITAFRRGGKLLICGNGGSAAESQHMAAELIGKYLHNRQALPAIALTTDTSILTSIGNDFGFDIVFSRQIEALGNEGDVLLTLSTSGKSMNVILAQKEAEARGMLVIDLPRIGLKTPEIQENQLKLIHKICEYVEREFV